MDDDGRRRANRIVALYAVAATAWMLLTTTVAFVLGGRPPEAHLVVDLVGGVVLIGVTAALLRVALLRWGERLSAAAEHERRAAENLTEVARIRTAFLDSISHELRTPLTNIMGLGQTIRTHHRVLPADKLERFADRLVANSARLERLIVNLLDLHRDASTIGIDPEPVHIEQLLLSTVAGTGPSSQAIRVWSPAQWVQVDRDKLERIVAELVGNVVRHTPAHTTAWVQATTVRGVLHIAVEDDGPGMDPAIMDAVMQPFVQGNDAREDPSPGLGIGLSLAARYVEMLGGEMTVSVPAGGGTRVTVSVPHGRAEASRTG